MNDYPYRPDEPERPFPAGPESEPAAEPEMSAQGAEPAAEGAGDTASPRARAASLPIKDAWKQVENFGQAVGAALQGRGNVVMVRVNDEALRHLDMLMEAEMTKSRSESAALLINEGIKANQALFDRIGEITEQIDALRAELRASVRRAQPDEE
ncbi:MAG TPA: hypothetical protein VFF68_01515 [Anaerolineaceae bacterium]|nr:hypothetical protein [Anaerolineaceae bacterium]